MIISISGKANSGKDLVGKIIQYLNSPVDKEENWKFDINDDYNGVNWEIKKFTDKLKDIVCILLDCSREDLENEEFKNKDLGEDWWCYKVHDDSVFRSVTKEHYNSTHKQKSIEKRTPKNILQLLGTEAGKEIIHPNIWVNSLMRNYTYTKKLPLIPSIGKNLEPLAERIYLNWIITDLRFPNEYKAVQKRNGLHIHLERFKVGDLVNWSNCKNSAEYEIFECYEEYALIGISGMGNRELEYEVEAPYSEISLVKSHIHKSENTDLLKESFDKNVVYLYNVGDVEELVEKIKVILLNNKIIKE